MKAKSENYTVMICIYRIKTSIKSSIKKLHTLNLSTLFSDTVVKKAMGNISKNISKKAQNADSDPHSKNMLDQTKIAQVMDIVDIIWNTKDKPDQTKLLYQSFARLNKSNSNSSSDNEFIPKYKEKLHPKLENDQDIIDDSNQMTQQFDIKSILNESKKLVEELEDANFLYKIIKKSK